MEFNTFYQELQYSTEMIRALLSGVALEAARLKPSAESWSNSRSGMSLIR